MEWTLTLSAIGTALATTAFAAWKSGQPKKDSLKARWISWPLVTVIAGGVLMLALIHAASLLGLNASAAGPYRP
jgi:Na+-driven multidrug efflux pump